MADTGAVFTVQVNNSIGGVLSNPATLTVTQNFTLANQLAAAVFSVQLRQRLRLARNHTEITTLPVQRSA